MHLARERYCVICGAHNATDHARCFACGHSLKVTQPLHSVAPVAPVPLLNARYHLLEQVGAGGFSTVHKAEDKQTNQLVAIKATSLRGLSSQEKIEATDAFNREVTMLSSIRHRHLPRIYDHFSDTECWYLAMEFIDGITLEHYMERNGTTSPLPLEEVLDLGLLLCEVVTYLHRQQPAIIFRDLKPSNIMLTREGHLFLIDFGIARRFRPGQTQDTILLGSPGYAAPEQYGRAQTSVRSDIYSLGAILHQLLSGQDPAQTPFTFAALPLQNHPELTQLDRLIQQMVSLDSNQRPDSMQIVKQELEQIALQHRQLRVLQQRRLHGNTRSPLPSPYTPVYTGGSPSSATTSGMQGQAQALFPPPQRQNFYYPSKRNSYAIAGLVLGIFGLIYPFFIGIIAFAFAISPMLGAFFFVIEPILAIILSSFGLYHQKTLYGPQAKTSVPAWIGLILGILILLLYLLLILG
jgi:serine/threonine protein kinase